MNDFPELKHPRFREMPRKKGNGVKRIQQGFFKLGPNAQLYSGPKEFRCPAGLGMSNVPVEGRWYDVTPYLLRCVRNGDLAEGTPPVVKPEPAPKKVKE